MIFSSDFSIITLRHWHFQLILLRYAIYAADAFHAFFFRRRFIFASRFLLSLMSFWSFIIIAYFLMLCSHFFLHYFIWYYFLSLLMADYYWLRLLMMLLIITSLPFIFFSLYFLSPLLFLRIDAAPLLRQLRLRCHYFHWFDLLPLRFIADVTLIYFLPFLHILIIFFFRHYFAAMMLRFIFIFHICFAFHVFALLIIISDAFISSLFLYFSPLFLFDWFSFSSIFAMLMPLFRLFYFRLFSFLRWWLRHCRFRLLLSFALFSLICWCCFDAACFDFLHADAASLFRCCRHWFISFFSLQVTLLMIFRADDAADAFIIFPLIADIFRFARFSLYLICLLIFFSFSPLPLPLPWYFDDAARAAPCHVDLFTSFSLPIFLSPYYFAIFAAYYWCFIYFRFDFSHAFSRYYFHAFLLLLPFAAIYAMLIYCHAMMLMLLFHWLSCHISALFFSLFAFFRLCHFFQLARYWCLLFAFISSIWCRRFRLIFCFISIRRYERHTRRDTRCFIAARLCRLRAIRCAAPCLLCCMLPYAAADGERAMKIMLHYFLYYIAIIVYFAIYCWLLWLFISLLAFYFMLDAAYHFRLRHYATACCLLFTLPLRFIAAAFHAFAFAMPRRDAFWCWCFAAFDDFFRQRYWCRWLIAWCRYFRCWLFCRFFISPLSFRFRFLLLFLYYFDIISIIDYLFHLFHYISLRRHLYCHAFIDAFHAFWFSLSLITNTLMSCCLLYFFAILRCLRCRLPRFFTADACL